MADDEYQKQMEEIKKNCPFCKIISGEIPSRKVYEDELVLAILDINPFRKGHTLLLPKEHYPILPLIPLEISEHLFKISKKLSICCAKATVNPYSNIFIANGQAAGQQSHHFMIHIIPNEKKGGFEIPKDKISDDEIKQIESNLKDTLNNLIKNHIEKNKSIIPKEIINTSKITPEDNNVKKQIAINSVFANLSIDEIVNVLFSNKEMLNVLLTDTDNFKKMIPNHPQLSVMFSKENVDNVISKLKEKAEQENKKTNIENMSFDEIVKTIVQNTLVRDAMLKDLEQFKTLIPKNPTLTKLFSNANLDEVYKKVKEIMKV